MTRDDIIRWAREAQQQDFASDTGHWFKMEVKDLERFARLIAEHEREKAAKWLISHGYATGHGDAIEDLLRHLVWEEREECAKVCIADSDSPEAQACAAAIRARSET